MTMPIDQTDYSVVVKLRAPPPKSWRWEIYRAGRQSAVQVAPGNAAVYRGENASLLKGDVWRGDNLGDLIVMKPKPVA
jgi:hypothetical protein